MSVSLYGSGQTVLQVVSSTYTSSFGTSSTSFVSTGYSASITPQSTTSKILVLVTGGMVSTASSQTMTGTIYRGSTNLGDSTRGLVEYYVSGTLQAPANMGIVDSPSTTSSTTYTIYAKTGGGTATWNIDPCVGSIILIEISGS